jgi:hypothetical protein
MIHLQEIEARKLRISLRDPQPESAIKFAEHFLAARALAGRCRACGVSRSRRSQHRYRCRLRPA